MIEVGCHDWPWRVYWEARRQEPREQLPEALKALADLGYQAWEGSLPEDEAELEWRSDLLRKAGLGMPSAHAGALLCGLDSQAVAEKLFKRCEWASSAGLKRLVLTALPMPEGAPKDAAHLAREAGALNALGRALKAGGQSLAFHFHASQWAGSGREWEELWAACDKGALGLCLEAEWMARSGADPAWVLDFCAREAGHVTHVHLRQCLGRVPLLRLGKGDLDWEAIAKILMAKGFDGSVMVEAYEDGGPAAWEDFRAALKDNRDWIRKVFEV